MSFFRKAKYVKRFIESLKEKTAFMNIQNITLIQL